MTTLTGTEIWMGEIRNSLDFFVNLRKDAYGKEETHIETIINVIEKATQTIDPQNDPHFKNTTTQLIDKYNKTLTGLHRALLKLTQNYSPSKARDFAIEWSIKERRLNEFLSSSTKFKPSKPRQKGGEVSAVQISMAFKIIRSKKLSSWQIDIINQTESLIKKVVGSIQFELVMLLRRAGEKSDPDSELKTLEILNSLNDVGFDGDMIIEQLLPIKKNFTISSIFKEIHENIHREVRRLKRRHESLTKLRVNSIAELIKLMGYEPKVIKNLDLKIILIDKIMTTKFNELFLTLIEVDDFLKGILSPIQNKSDLFKETFEIMGAVSGSKGDLLAVKIQKYGDDHQDINRELSQMFNASIIKVNDIIAKMVKDGLRQPLLSKEFIARCERLGINIADLRKEVEVPKQMIQKMNVLMKKADELYQYLELALDQRAAIELINNVELGRNLLRFNDFLTRILDYLIEKPIMVRIPMRIYELRQYIRYLERIETLITIASIENPRTVVSEDVAKLVQTEITQIMVDYEKIQIFKKKLLFEFEKDLLKISPQLIIELFGNSDYIKNPFSFKQVLDNYIDELNVARVNRWLTTQEFKRCKRKIRFFSKTLKLFGAFISKAFPEERIQFLKYM